MNIKETEIIEALREAGKRPVHVKELIRRFHVQSEERSSFRRMVKEMSLEGKIVRIKGGRYSLLENTNTIKGRIQGHPDGYAFLIPDEKGEADVYISPRNLRDAMHGDRVMLRIEPKRRGKREGVVIKVLERAYSEIIGTYYMSGKNAYVIPEDRRISQNIYIRPKGRSNAKNGKIVKVEITRYPTLRYVGEGKVIDVLGYSDDPEVEYQIVIHKYDLPLEFSKGALKEAEKVPKSIIGEEIEKRRDFRKFTTFTIDGETAKDFDDAVSIKRLDKGEFRLGVHIADVSFYVKEKGELDKEAQTRGTSVYFPDRCIPMLPPRLSDDICSLRPDEERLTMSVIMDFDKRGNMKKYEIEDTVIKSRERMTYTNVAKILDGDKALTKKYKGIKDELFLMKELAELLREKRMAEGSIDFDLPEADVILDSGGKIENIVQAERNMAHKVIEEFMLAANKTVASYLFWMEIPSLYRVHEKPDPLKIEEFNEFVHGFGYHIKGGREIHPRALQSVLEKIKGRPEERLINTLLLRSMKQARYSEENIGHFALSFDNYTHFTSPIRRYPDLVVHRILREVREKGKFSKKRVKELEGSLPGIALHSSHRERLAEEAERDIVDLKKAQFMMDKIGEEYFGYITGVTPFGLFVELEDLFIEGLVHITSLTDDYYIYLENQHMLKGETKGKTYTLGERVSVRVEGVSIEKREIDFSLLKKSL